MITGERLSDILSFNRGVVQDEILKTASSLLEVDKRLNALRIDEALAWSRYSGGKPADDRLASSIREVSEMAGLRQRRVSQAIEAAREAEVEAASLRRPHADAAARLAEARAAFQEAERSALKAAGADPEVLRLRAAAEAVRAHRARLEGWAAEAASASAPMLASYDADRAFAYLRGRGFGTESYRAGPLARLLDRRLARRCGYAGAAEARAAIEGYPAAAQSWMRECDAILDGVAGRLKAAEGLAMAGLDGPRAALAAALNEEDALSRRTEALEAARRDAIGTVLRVALGKDGECRAMAESLVAMMARERSEAMIRAAASPEGPDTAASSEMDAIVRQRIALSMEADGMRMHLAGASARLRAVEEVASRLALRGWASRAVAFGLEERTMLVHDLSMGRIGAEAAWSEIEESLEAGDQAQRAA